MTASTPPSGSPVRKADPDRVRDSARRFYRRLSGQLVADYLSGNPRIVAAIGHVLRAMPPEPGRVLDVGCGIGWSSHEIARQFSGVEVVGVDSSEAMTDTATRLFGDNARLTFINGDITTSEVAGRGPFDAIVMLDVYEHIARDAREQVHAQLADVLADDGTIILTVPSASHQQGFRERVPHELQPVDEDVTETDIERLAGAIGGHVAFFQPVTIWNEGDYVHAVVTRRPGTWLSRQGGAVEPKADRVARVAGRFRCRLVGENLLAPDDAGPVVCVASGDPIVRASTFMCAHVERLDARVRVLYGGQPPRYADDGRALLSPVQPWPLARAAVRKLLRRPWDWYDVRAVKRYLRRQKVEAVLAEYGPTGVSMMRACRELGIPLVVHFHGYDAYQHATLADVGKHYPELFDTAAAIVAVSRDMMAQLESLGAPAEKLHYCPCGADVALFGGADPAASDPVFASVGRFVDKKAPHLTLLAFSKAHQVYPESRLIMVGDGPLLESTRQLARALGVADAVRFTGRYSHAAVAAVMAESRALVQHSLRPSNGDSEGTPVSVTEAGAMGLPVVATRHAGIADVVVHEQTGLLVDEGDVDGMAAAMCRLLDDAGLAGQLGSAAAARVGEQFSLDRSIATLNRIVRDAIGR